jgi:hypothetical protein
MLHPYHTTSHRTITEPSHYLPTRLVSLFSGHMLSVALTTKGGKEDLYQNPVRVTELVNVLTKGICESFCGDVVLVGIPDGPNGSTITNSRMQAIIQKIRIPDEATNINININTDFADSLTRKMLHREKTKVLRKVTQKLTLTELNRGTNEEAGELLCAEGFVAHMDKNPNALVVLVDDTCKSGISLAAGAVAIDAAGTLN